MKRHKPFEHALLCGIGIIWIDDSIILDERFEGLAVMEQCPKITGWPLRDDEGPLRAAHLCVT